MQYEMSICDQFAELAAMTGLSEAALGETLACDERTIRRYLRCDSEVDEARLESLRRIVSGRLRKRRKPTFKFIDLFAGIGGMRIAFERVGGECVFTSELDRHARLSYRANFPESVPCPINKDINLITDPRKQIPDFDVLLAGFPCQPFSLAGVSKKNALGKPHGFECKDQGNLFFKIADILGACQPPVILLENVKNLKSHDNGNTFRVIRGTLEGKNAEYPDVSYEIFDDVIDARHWVPQHRERLFILGLNRAYFSQRPDINLKEMVMAKAPLHRPTMSSVLHSSSPLRDHERFVDPAGKVLDKYRLSEHLWNYLQDYARKHREKGNGFGYGLVNGSDVARTLSARYHKDGAEILVDPAVDGESTPRRLTPQECARLMGFEQGERHWTFSDRVSDTQIYRQFGNSVAVPVVEAIADVVKPLISSVVEANLVQPAA